MVLEQWMWWVLTLFFVVFTFYWADIRLLWVTIATAVVGALLWHTPELPIIYQLMIAGLIIAAGILITDTFLKRGRDASQQGEEDLPTEDDYIGEVFTLEKPIKNGNGSIEFRGLILRIRGRDMDAGAKVRIIAADGIDRTLCLVEKVKDSET